MSKSRGDTSPEVARELAGRVFAEASPEVVREFARRALAEIRRRMEPDYVREMAMSDLADYWGILSSWVMRVSDDDSVLYPLVRDSMRSAISEIRRRGGPEAEREALQVALEVAQATGA
jgi:hypothetical protein